MAKVPADFIQIEMLQTAIAGVMKENHDKHHLCLGRHGITVITTVGIAFIVYFANMVSKKLEKFVCRTE